MVPGFTGSGPGHWQSHWQRERAEYRRVDQRDWGHPEPGEWLRALDQAITDLRGEVVLVGHSLGCTLIAAWAAARGPGSVVAALLVAPSDVEAPTAPEEVRGFAPVPLQGLPFRTVVVASTTDPLVTFERARWFAQRWGGQLISIGPAGHIHTAAGYGPWPEGHAILRRLLEDAPLRARSAGAEDGP
jgi:hypothetical protein